MTYADVVSQMQQIQSVLASLSPVAQTATSATGATDFASALDSASTTGAAATTAADGAQLTAAGVTGGDVVKAALEYKGVPYVLGGESKSGIDCSGLVQAAFKDLGVTVPRLVHQQETIGTKVDSLKDARPGDLIVLNGGDHIAIYAGNDTVIHAPYAGRTVSVQKVWFDDSQITSIRRVVPSTADAGTEAAVSGTGATTTSGGSVSAATVARATALMAMYGTSDSGSGSSDSSSGGSMLAGLLGSTGTALPSAVSSPGSTSTTQQLIAARAAALGAGS